MKFLVCIYYSKKVTFVNVKEPETKEIEAFAAGIRDAGIPVAGGN